LSTAVDKAKGAGMLRSRSTRVPVFLCGLVLALVASVAVGQTENTVRFGLTAELVHLSPYLPHEFNAKSVFELVYEKLVFVSPDTFVPVPGLAESWEVSDDGRTWVFTLRRGVRFHDGEEFDAQAVKENFAYFMNPEHRYSRASILDAITAVDVLGTHTVAITTDEPVGPFLAGLIAHPSLVMKSPQLLRSSSPSDLEGRIVGTGPFRLASWSPGRPLIVERFPDYWGGDVTNIDRIEVITVPEDGTRAVMLETGELDVVYSLSVPDAERLASHPDIHVVFQPVSRIMYLRMHNMKPPFDDVRVRRAANYAVDRTELVETILSGRADIADAPVTRVVPHHHPGLGAFPYDPEQSCQILSDAGFVGNVPVRLTVPTARYIQAEELAEAIAFQMREACFEVSLEFVEFGAMRDMRGQPPERHQLEMYYFGWGAESLDGDWDLRIPYHTDEWAPHGHNDVHFSNAEFDRLTMAAFYEVDGEAANELYRRAQEILWEELPNVWLFSIHHPVGHRRSLEGVVVAPYEFVLLQNAKVVD